MSARGVARGELRPRTAVLLLRGPALGAAWDKMWHLGPAAGTTRGKAAAQVPAVDQLGHAGPRDAKPTYGGAKGCEGLGNRGTRPFYELQRRIGRRRQASRAALPCRSA